MCAKLTFSHPVGSTCVKIHIQYYLVKQTEWIQAVCLHLTTCANLTLGIHVLPRSERCHKHERLGKQLQLYKLGSDE